MTELDWLDDFAARVEQLEQNPPPAPPGMELVECDATPRHWPTYVATVDGMYPAPCGQCTEVDLQRHIDKMNCEREHRRWKTWRIVARISSRLYTLGITANGGSTWFGRCEFCGVGIQHRLPDRIRGRRYYILGVTQQTWFCLMRGHRSRMTDYGMCSVCQPCPSCGSTDPGHDGDCWVQP